MTQADRVLARLLRGSLTATQALHEEGCGRLAARIKDLRERGHVIHTDIEVAINRYGEECRIGVYRLINLAR